METIQLTKQQFCWLAAKIQDEYSRAWRECQELRSPASVSYYRRNNVEDIRIRNIEDYERTMRFCIEFSQVLTKAGE